MIYWHVHLNRIDMTMIGNRLFEQHQNRLIYKRVHNEVGQLQYLCNLDFLFQDDIA